MLTFIRRIVFSKVGAILTLGVLAVIALAFAAGDITGVRQGSGQSLGTALADVGGQRLTDAELRQRMQATLEGARQQQPTADMAGLIAQGAYEAILDRTITTLALEDYAALVGIHVGKPAVDGVIAAIPSFQGLDGKFNQQVYDAAIAQQRLSDAQVRRDIARDIVARQLLGPTLGAAQVPAQLALPYASLLLERRQGTVGYLPVAALPAGAAPSEAELQAFYTRNRARYTVPERRVLRYAVVKAADVAAAAKPTEADIAAAYRGAGSRFAANEKRTLSQVILADQAAAGALAAKIKGGMTASAAARAAGLEAAELKGVEKTAYARAASQSAADAAFGAANGATVGPVRTPLGWAVIKVDAIDAVAAKTLDQARAELEPELAKTKAAQALADIHDKLDDAAADNATFDELVADAKLAAQTTPPVTAAGIDPAAPGQPDPAMAQIARAGFAAEQGDAPQLVQTAADGSFAVVAVGQTVPAAPPPLARIRDQVAKDLIADRNFRAARQLAIAAVGRIGNGTPIAQALGQSGAAWKVTPYNLTRAELARSRRELPPAVTMMFSMAAKRAKFVEAPGRSGYFVVYLDSIQGGNAAGNAALVASTRQGLGSVSGREFAEQFVAAARAKVGVERNPAAIAKLKAELAGGVPAAQ